MRLIFLDTSGLVAMMTATDNRHGLAVEQLARLQRVGARFVLHEGIRIELLDTLSSVRTRATGVRMVRNLLAWREAGEVQIYRLDNQLIDRATRLFEARPDKEWGLTDCLSFVLMRDLDIYEAFTCDHHFEQAGFVRLIAD